MNKLFASLLTMGVVMVAGATDFHPGKIPTLKLRHISNEDLTATLDGYAEVRGKLQAVWELGPDKTTPKFSRYTLLLDEASSAVFPTLDDYQVRSIHVRNGAETLKRAAGPAVAEAFGSRSTLRVMIEGSFRLSDIGMGIECGQLHVGAKVDSVSSLRQLATSGKPAPMTVC